MPPRSPSRRGIYLFFVCQLILVIVAAKLWRGADDSATPASTPSQLASFNDQTGFDSWPVDDHRWSAVLMPLEVAITATKDPSVMSGEGSSIAEHPTAIAASDESITAAESLFEGQDKLFATDPFATTDDPAATFDHRFGASAGPFTAAKGALATVDDHVAPSSVPGVTYEDPSPPIQDELTSSSSHVLASAPASTRPVPPTATATAATTVATVPAAPLASKTPVPAPAAMPWCAPAAITGPLQQLSESPEYAPWANAVRHSLSDVLQSTELSDEQLARTFSDLEQLSRQEVRPDRSPDAVLQRQQAYCVRRRVELWKAVHEASRRVDPHRAYNDGAWMAERCDRMTSAVDALEVALDARQSGNAWRQVFRIQELHDLAKRRSPSEITAQQQVANGVLDELDAMKRFRGSDAVWELPSMIQFIDRLHVWAIEPVALTEILSAVEALEIRPAELAARDLARATQGLLASDQQAHHQVGSVLESHYRNANLRLVLSDELINRFLPTVPAAVRPVRDRMFGAQISGRSYNTTRLSLRAVPDTDTWNLRLEARGRVTTRTRARKGPVVTYNHGRSEFTASKPVVIDQTGVHSGRTEVTARGQTRLRGLESRLDNIPILGLMVRRFAHGEHDKTMPKARRLFASRVVGQVRGEIDEKVGTELERSKRSYAQRVRQPLADLALDPQSLQLSTTDDRELLVRYRVAADSQLGAFTARPRAMAGSLLSVQIHQSTLNNVVQQLGLAGRRLELRQLMLEIADKMQLADFELPEDLPEDVTLTFAATDPLRVEFQDGRMTMRIRLARLSAGRRRWRNFEARAHYVPDVRGVQVAMQRAESVQLLGARLSFRDQVALRAIFTKVFSKNRELTLVKPQVVEHPALAQAHLSQLEIRDGWIGISLSDVPPATASLPATDRR